MVKNNNEEPRKRHHYVASSSDDSDDSDDNNTPSHKSPKSKSQSCVQLSAAPVHRVDDKESKTNEEKMNRNLKALHGESDDNNNDKENGIDDGVVDDFKELAQELNEKK